MAYYCFLCKEKLDDLPTEEEIQANRLPIDNLGFSKSGSELLFRSRNKRLKCNLQNYEIQEISKEIIKRNVKIT